jgi:hypothetical protein
VEKYLTCGFKGKIITKEESKRIKVFSLVLAFVFSFKVILNRVCVCVCVCVCVFSEPGIQSLEKTTCSVWQCLRVLLERLKGWDVTVFAFQVILQNRFFLIRIKY